MVPAVFIRSAIQAYQRVPPVVGTTQSRRVTVDAEFDEAIRRAERFMDRIEISRAARDRLDEELAVRRR